MPRITFALKLTDLKSLEGPYGWIGRIAWSPSGDFLAAPSQDCTVRIWRFDYLPRSRTISSLDALHTLEVGEEVTACTWSPNGTYLAATTVLGGITVFGAGQTVTPGSEIVKRDASVMAWIADDRGVAYMRDGNVLEWHMGGAGPAPIPTPTLDGPINDLALSPDGKVAAFVSGDGRLGLLRLQTQRILRIFDDSSSYEALQWSPDGKTIWGAGRARLSAWKARSGIRFEDHPHFSIAQHPTITCASDGSMICVASRGETSIFDARNLSTLYHRRLGKQDASSYPPGGWAFHPQYPVLATLDDDDSAIMLRTYSLTDTEAPASPRALHPDFVSSPPAIPDELVRAVADGGCVLFAGGGISAQSNVPGWTGFVRDLLGWAWKHEWFDDTYATALDEALSKGEVSQVAEAVMSHAAPTDETADHARSSQLHEFLRTQLNTPDATPSAAHHLIAQIPFRAIITTNLDDLLERVFPNAPTFLPSDAEKILEIISQAEPFLLHLYGRVQVAGSQIITRSQYEDALSTNRWFARILETILVSRTIFFAGMSLDSIDALLSPLRSLMTSGRSHYALVDVQGEAWRVTADSLKRRFGVQVIPYDPSNDHANFEAFLQNLARRSIDARAGFAPGPRFVGEEAHLLRKVTLNDIGPFDELSIDLTPHWSVVLGANGVGKSTLLRAMAVGLAGRDATPFATKLVKSGRTHARIELETTQHRYVTELFATDSGVEIKGDPPPSIVEGWLALGFPALRAMTWNREPTTPRGRPTTADVMPLIKGEPDPRSDAFKAWLIDAVSSELNGAADLLPMLTQILQKLTPGLALHLDRVDAVNREILVRSNDALLPLETISQGTASLLGWMGVFLQRQIESHSKARGADAWQKPALVMIDEVDAHMHPTWQRRLIPAMTTLFPQLQVVSTTHSSLIVSPLTSAQLTVLRRHEGRLQVLRPEEDPQGFRADQILTSNLFGLDDTVDVETRRLLDMYADLLGVTHLDAGQKRALAEVTTALRKRMPSPAQRRDARETADLFREYLRATRAAMSPEEIERHLREVRVQLTDALVGH